MAHVTEDTNLKEVLVSFSSEAIAHWYSLGFDLIAILDKNGFIKYISDNIHRFLGVNPETLVNTFAFDLVHPDDVELAKQKFNECSDSLLTTDVDLRLVKPNGDILYIHSKGEPISHNDKLIGIVVMSNKNVLFMGECLTKEFRLSKSVC